MAAEPVQIQGSQYEGKIRTPIITVVLTIVTLGIYGIVWYFKVEQGDGRDRAGEGHRGVRHEPGELAPGGDAGRACDRAGARVRYNVCKRLQAAERLTGAPQGMEPGLLFILYVFISPVAAYIAQSNLNKVLQAQARPAPGGRRGARPGPAGAGPGARGARRPGAAGSASAAAVADIRASLARA